MLKKIFIISLSILLFNCDIDGVKPTLVGTWRYEYNTYTWQDITFREDKTYVLSGSNQEMGSYAYSGDYTKTDSTFTLYYGGYYYVHEYKFSGTDLVIINSGVEVTYTKQ